MKKRTLLMTLALAAAVIATGCGGGGDTTTETASAPSGDAAPSAAPAAAGPTGMVTGTISYTDGDPDAPIQMGADPECKKLHSTPVESEKVVQADGKLANVFIYVKEGLPAGSYDAPATPHKLDQQGCRYVPHVSGIMVGQTLEIHNSDALMHNVNARAEVNDGFNNAQPPGFPMLEKSFDDQEIMVSLRCDVHPWMQSYLAVMAHPFYAVSATDGTYEIDDLPVGDYVLEAWHEHLGTKTMDVSVTEDAASAASFDFTPAAG